MVRWFSLALLPVVASCGSSPSQGADAGTIDIRGQRYCEILVGKISGDQVHVDVYNTQGLNDCPADTWSQENPAQLQTDFSADFVKLNGPRYWMIDSLGDSMLLNTTPVSLGGIEMRLAGGIDFPLSALSSLGAPYKTHTIERHTSFTFLAGKPVFELVDAQGHVYTMQSYSVQTTPQTIDSLSGLGSQLMPPAGWSFRTRTLTEDLNVTAMNGTATVVQDEDENTYLQSQ